jgi:hypothetical protein
MSEQDYRAGLEQLTAALRELHRRLIDVAKVEYERARGPIGGPGALLQLLMGDPAFAWLRPLSGLMADLDALLDGQGPISSADAAAARAEVEGLLAEPAARDTPFTPAYLDVLQCEPGVIPEHARVRRAFEALPVNENAADLLHRRHRWVEAVKHRHRGK